ncbi:hypothetical protein COS91_00865 [Candidatus Desantisbacteria bacterium CG07_land_8_20_14_0_80_39_15]|uniref:Xylose isomerase-like TIM barrel domain-containing protein n=2 Tax=unclassified Candidatus Desantisiibacteriota TaxID=3106372 RepID=A0A2H9PCY7_9BACT|nr:MAG: hypothetical protein COS91_00865 [Candidatus Desantisbacteria bacterium CG07_land_8_20_14_0_80_39_15]PIZ17230.1 MAG: hypothetical protein COY51_00835 [Candidatus Desantisbacteria bacterium CG_4_10_14_0_8_um_filter_39_17]
MLISNRFLYATQNLGKTLKSIGIEGVDLTVRKGGHVEPAEVKEKLPIAKEALLREGVKITMITTEITDINQLYAKDVLGAASNLGIGYFKLGYYAYQEFGSLRKLLREANAKLKDIAKFCEEKKIKAGYHNHSGNCLGASLPHLIDLLENCSPEWVGAYYDIGHAAIEGGYSGWKMNLDYISNRLFMVAVKDLSFARIKDVDPSSKWPWKTQVVPLGEGLVNWKEFSDFLKTLNFNGPLSMHSEYQLPVEQVVEQTKKDLTFLRKIL